MTEDRALQEGFAKAWMVWGAMLGSLIVYLVIVTVLAERGSGGAGPRTIVGPLAHFLYGCAVTAFIGAAAVRRVLLRRPMEPSAIRADTNAWPSIVRVIRRYNVAIIASLSLCELIAVVGLVFYIVARDHDTCFLLTLFSAIAMLIFRPDSDELERLVHMWRQGQDASSTPRR